MNLNSCICGAAASNSQYAEHTEECVARRDFLDAVDDVLFCGVTLSLMPLVLFVRGAELLIVKARGIVL